MTVPSVPANAIPPQWKAWADAVETELNDTVPGTYVAQDDPVGGDLTGTILAPSIAPGVIGDANIDLGDPIGEDKLALPEEVHVVGASGEPAFGTGWASGFGITVGFWKQNGLVYLRGLAARSTTTASHQTIFTLPVGYRPPLNAGVLCPDLNLTATYGVRVNTAGTVTFMPSLASAIAGVYLNSVVFRAA